MNVALIKCPWWVRYCPPYLLAYLSSLLRQQGHQAVCFDLNNTLYHAAGAGFRKYWDDRDHYAVWETPALIERLISEVPFDAAVDRVCQAGARVYVFDTHTPSVLLSYALARRIKQRHADSVIVFLGHKAARAQMAFDFIRQPYVDYVCPGEADLALLDLLAALEHAPPGTYPSCAGFLSKRGDEIIDGGDPRPAPDLNVLPIPDYADFAQDIAAGTYAQPHRLDILDSRGCVNACHFCYERLFWPKYRALSGARIFEHILAHHRRFPGVNYFYFNGLLINGDLAQLEGFCDLVIAHQIPVQWAGQAIARPDMSRGLLDKMKRAGCQWLGYGVESGSQRVLDVMNKPVVVRELPRILRDTREAGIAFQVNIMFGFPTETEEDFLMTLGLLREIRPWVDNILASQSFFTLEKNTFVARHPERFGIDDHSHHLYWSSDGGKNTYAERFRRYETFCALALDLGMPETSGVRRVKPDKWLQLGQYYRHVRAFSRAAECFERSLALESDNETVRAMRDQCRQEQGPHE